MEQKHFRITVMEKRDMTHFGRFAVSREKECSTWLMGHWVVGRGGIIQSGWINNCHNSYSWELRSWRSEENMAVLQVF